jgi:hypothetical protein
MLENVTTVIFFFTLDIAHYLSTYIVYLKMPDIDLT